MTGNSKRKNNKTRNITYTISSAYSILQKNSKHNNHKLPSNSLCSTDNQSTYFHRLFSFHIYWFNIVISQNFCL